MWSDRRNRAFIGVTAHFIGINFSFLSHVIAFKQLSGSHTAELIVHELDEIIDSYGIRSKIVRIVTDNGANVIKAMRFFNDDSNDSETRSPDDPVDISDSSAYDEIVIDSDEEISEEEDMSGDESDQWPAVFQDTIGLLDSGKNESANLRCYAHTMQLVIKDSLKSITSLSALTKKCFSIAQKSHNIQAFSEAIANSKLKSIPKFNVTRWNSELQTLKGVANIYSQAACTVEKILTDNKLAHLKLKPGQIEVLDGIIEVLSPFEVATDLLQGESYCTISEVAPTILQLLSQLEELNEKYGTNQTGGTRSTTVTKLIQELKTNIRKRFRGTFNFLYF